MRLDFIINEMLKKLELSSIYYDSSTIGENVKKMNTSLFGNIASLANLNKNKKKSIIFRSNTYTNSNTKLIKVKLDDFSFIRLIGVGSYGHVYVARKKSNNKLYAVKVLNKNQFCNSSRHLSERASYFSEILLRRAEISLALCVSACCR